MTREEWLFRAVEELDTSLFNGDLDVIQHQFQISCGETGSKTYRIYQPTVIEDISKIKMEDFFPTTIIISHYLKTPQEILISLAYACIHAFFNESKTNTKQFKSLANKYYFNPPYKEPTPSSYLLDIIDDIYIKLKKLIGDWPGKAIVLYEKEKKEGKKSSLEVFCPSCNYSMTIKKSILDKYNGALPTCPCGTKMGLNCKE